MSLYGESVRYDLRSKAHTTLYFGYDYTHTYDGLVYQDI